jgi:long-chain acyl-CoA synthetase
VKENATNLNQALLAAMDDHAGQTCFRVKRGGRYWDITYGRFRGLALRLASYLHRRGVSRVAIVADNCLDWMVGYIGCLLSGGAVIPLRTSLAPDTLRSILQDAGVDLAVLSNIEHVKALATTLHSGEKNGLPDLKEILVAGDERDLPDGATSMGTVFQDIPPLATETLDEICSHAAGVTPQALASILYTISSSGQPQGIAFDHGRGLATMRHMSGWFTFDPDDLAFALMPWGEFSSLIVSLHCFLSGVPSALSESYEPVLENMQQTSPTVMIATPAFLERTYEFIMKEQSLAPESSREVFWWAVSKGREYLAAGSAASSELLREYRRADLTFFSQIRGQVGGRMRRLYSTAGSLPEEVASFFDAIGLAVLNVYSLPQAGGFPAVSRPGDHHPRACGQVAPGFQVRIAEDGEVLVRGESVMLEYWRQPEDTGQAFDADGWLYSGDLGRLDEDGYLYITGRKDNLMVLSTGRKIVPSVIERMLTASPYVLQAVIVAEGKPYVSALIMPDLKALASHFAQDRNGDPVKTTSHPKVDALLDKAIGEVNSQLDLGEQIREYTLLEQPLSKETGELTTASMSLRRHVIAERYTAQIENMYPLGLQPERREVTQITVNPERLRELVENERVLQAWKKDLGIDFLFDLATDKQIDALSMVHICDTAVAVAQMASEEKSLSTTLIVGDLIQIAGVLPPSNFQLLRHEHIGRMRRILVTMAKIVDGQVLGYVVDKYGYVRGVHRLQGTLHEQPGLLLGPQLGHYATISRRCDAVVFFVPPKGRQVRVFANGDLVGRYANGDWSPEDLSHVDEMITQLVEQKEYRRALVERVLRCAYQMSGENLGAIFLIGDAGFVLQHADASEIRSFAAFDVVDIDQLTDREVINFAKQDGAVVIDVHGRIRACMVQLRPRADTEAEIGPGKGARHSSAAKMSAEAGCLAITVSQDGPITLYDGGRRILSL